MSLGIGLGVVHPRGATAAAAFVPSDLPSLSLWLSADSGAYADAGSTLATDGQTVQQWNDQSGNANHGSQGTADDRATYTANVLNGLPVLRFDGTNKYSLTSAIALAGAFTAYVVGSRTATTSWFTPLGGDTGLLTCLRLSITSNVFTFAFDNSTSNATTATNTSTAAQAFCWNRDGSDQLSVYVDDSAAQEDFATRNATATFAMVGDRVAGGITTTGDIAEVLLYAADHDAGQRAQVFAYLMSRYGIS